MSTLYISFDVETDGDTPLLNNMLSIGMVGFTQEGKIIWTYETGFDTYNKSMEKTMSFWTSPSQKIAYEKLMSMKKISAKEFYIDLSEKLTELSKSYLIKFCAKPANFDWMFLKCYFEKGKSEVLGDDYGKNGLNIYDIGFKCYDISECFNTYKLVSGFDINNKKIFSNIENTLSNVDNSLTHDALSDAICQGIFYIRLLFLMSNPDNLKLSLDDQMKIAKSIQI